MIISRTKQISGIAGSLSFSIEGIYGATFRVVTNYGSTAYFKVDSVEYHVPVVDGRYRYDGLKVVCNRDNIVINNPSMLKICAILEVYSESDLNLHDEKILDIYDIKDIRYVKDGVTGKEEIDSASIVGNSVEFSTGLDMGTYVIYGVSVGIRMYDVNATMNVEERNGSNVATIDRYIVAYV